MPVDEISVGLMPLREMPVCRWNAYRLYVFLDAMHVDKMPTD
jgi:hypothetical protein